MTEQQYQSHAVNVSLMQFVLEELAADMLHVSIRLFEINRWCHARYAILEARRFRNADAMLNRALDGLTFTVIALLLLRTLRLIRCT